MQLTEEEVFGEHATRPEELEGLLPAIMEADKFVEQLLDEPVTTVITDVIPELGDESKSGAGVVTRGPEKPTTSMATPPQSKSEEEPVAEAKSKANTIVPEDVANLGPDASLEEAKIKPKAQKQVTWSPKVGLLTTKELAKALHPKPILKEEAPVYGGLRLAQLEESMDPLIRNQMDVIRQEHYRKYSIGIGKMFNLRYGLQSGL